MYLTYAQYLTFGNGSVSEADFCRSEAWAEALLDHWTLNRLHTVDWSKWECRVAMVMARLVDSKASVESEADGAPVTHFSNGQDSYTFQSFGDPVFNLALGKCYGYAVDVLPVEIISACVRYNGAR